MPCSSLLLLFLAVFSGLSLGAEDGTGYIGCFLEAADEGRELPNERAITTGPDDCRVACDGYLYFGLQYGGQCWCGDKYGTYGTSDQCTMPCSGNPTFNCGNSLVNSVYYVTIPVCSNQGIDVNGNCACYSGFGGADCSSSLTSECEFPTVPPLQTQVVAEFMANQSSISSNTFTFVINSPATFHRYFSSISLNQVPGCSYPSSHFTKDFTDCMDVFIGSFGIPEVHETCGFIETGEEGSTVLSGRVHLTAVDDLGQFRGHQILRTTSSSLALELRFPTSVFISTNLITLFSSISLMSAVTSQEYLSLNDTAIIQITTSVQWPYLLLNPSLGENTNGFFASTEIAEDDCSFETVGSDCLQITTLTFTNLQGGESCFLNGNYSLEWNYNCRGEVECPVQEGETAVAEFALESENFCATIEVSSELSGELKSYIDNTFATENVVYLAGNRMFFKASIMSDVPIDSITIQELRLRQGVKVFKTILQGGVIVTPYEVIDFLYEEGLGSNELGFSFLALTGTDEGALFSSMDPDHVFSFVVEADLSVTYRTSFGEVGLGKRDLQMTSMTFASTVGLYFPRA